MTNNMKKVFKSTKSSPALILEPIKESDPKGKNKKVSCMVVMVVTGIMGCMPCRTGFPVKGQSHHICFFYKNLLLCSSCCSFPIHLLYSTVVLLLPLIYFPFYFFVVAKNSL
jgi:hypothetical protein